MAEPQTKLDRALNALRDDVWSEHQHRRVGRRLEEALPPAQKQRRRWVPAAGAIVAAAACVALWLTWRAASAPLESGAALGNSLSPARATLADGSLVDIDRGGRIKVVTDQPEETRVEVLAGRAEFDVQKRVNRPFFAVIRGVEVRVVGTHFSTELDLSRPPGLVRVSVQHGVVEVRAPSGDHLARLKAGDALEISLAKQDRTAEAAASVGAVASALPASAEPTGVAVPGDSAALPGNSAAVPGNSAAPARALDASELFEAGREARRAGNVQAAVKAYAALIKQFPSDERVAVAALELGRLRMDSLHAYGSAAEAFRRAMSAARNEGIREDALARLIEALSAMGDQTACLDAQRSYQARYPRGVHAAAVRSRCSRAEP